MKTVHDEIKRQELLKLCKEVDGKARVVERETLPSNRKTKKKKRSANADLSYTPRPPRATPSSTKAENRKKKTVRSVKTTGQPDLRTKRAETRERHLGHQDKTTRDNLLRSRITRRLRITNAATRIGHELPRITTEKQGKRALWIRIQKSIEHKMQRRDFKRILQEKVVSTLKSLRCILCSMLFWIRIHSALLPCFSVVILRSSCPILVAALVMRSLLVILLLSRLSLVVLSWCPRCLSLVSALFVRRSGCPVVFTLLTVFFFRFSAFVLLGVARGGRGV